jgi:hypothetical protein
MGILTPCPRARTQCRLRQLCHSDRSKVIRKCESPAEWRNLLFHPRPRTGGHGFQPCHEWFIFVCGAAVSRTLSNLNPTSFSAVRLAVPNGNINLTKRERGERRPITRTRAFAGHSAPVLGWRLSRIYARPSGWALMIVGEPSSSAARPPSRAHFKRGSLPRSSWHFAPKDDRN